jgi:hypothetical protein
MYRDELEDYKALIGNVYSDLQIWGQYEGLFDFVFEEFPKSERRFDEIALPTLFTLSHAIELGLKENIIFFRKYHENNHLSKFKNWNSLVKSHHLKDLAEEFKSGYYKLHKKVNASEKDKHEFLKYYKDLKKLTSILERNSETFRYYFKLDNKGSKKKESIEHSKMVDLIEIKKLFENVKIILTGASQSLGIYTDFIDFQKANPDYNKGKGYLYCQKLPGQFLEQIKEKLNQALTKIGENKWINSKTGENFEIEIYNNEIYIIAIK